MARDCVMWRVRRLQRPVRVARVTAAHATAFQFAVLRQLTTPGPGPEHRSGVCLSSRNARTLTDGQRPTPVGDERTCAPSGRFDRRRHLGAVERRVAAAEVVRYRRRRRPSRCAHPARAERCALARADAEPPTRAVRADRCALRRPSTRVPRPAARAPPTPLPSCAGHVDLADRRRATAAHRCAQHAVARCNAAGRSTSRAASRGDRWRGARLLLRGVPRARDHRRSRPTRSRSSCRRSAPRSGGPHSRRCSSRGGGTAFVAATRELARSMRDDRRRRRPRFAAIAVARDGRRAECGQRSAEGSGHRAHQRAHARRVDSSARRDRRAACRATHNGAFGAERGGERPPECVSGHCGVDVGNVWGEPRLCGARWRHRLRQSRPERGARRRVRADLASRRHAVQLVLPPRRGPARDPARREGQRPAQVVGLLGDTGVKHSAPHLHFALSVKTSKHARERYLDPEPLIAIWPLWIPNENRHRRRARDVASPACRSRNGGDRTEAQRRRSPKAAGRHGATRSTAAAADARADTSHDGRRSRDRWTACHELDDARRIGEVRRARGNRRASIA